MKLLSITCPSCGANMGEPCRHGNRFVCEYCGGTTYVTDAADMGWNEDEAKGTAEGMAAETKAHKRRENYNTPLCFINGSVPNNAELNRQLDEIMELQKKFPTSDSIAAELRRVFDGRKEVTTDSWQQGDHQKIARKINLEPGETLLLYKCAALLPMNRLKAGMFLTNKRIGYLGLFGTEALHYRDVETFLVEIGFENAIYWYPNGDEKVFISAFGCNGEELALLLTFALLKVAESTPDGFVVELKMK